MTSRRRAAGTTTRPAASSCGHSPLLAAQPRRRSAERAAPRQCLAERHLVGVLQVRPDREAARQSCDRDRAVGARAHQLAETKYSYEAYLARTRQACAHLFGDRAPQMAGKVA